ncbi:UvrD-helicase domain-containing protein [Streptomyces sp. ET3-23]|uniref:nuclease-related domain-containing DEAD/DEAH box helicase n=1 Tax=Streptomyces sp. ET3-23 TaxID=2885643 RepID=UPI001D12E4F5|nr:UvrD-helicase domain-containing protein [Streptomyces sp. ET3-23]MCC2275601.1 UvrD-helicase domain-containing protein [Streptomyces sp. ET3-23]
MTVAGGSALNRAQEARRHERELREQLWAAQREARRWEAAGEGEQRVHAQLLVLAQRGWRLLVDRRWPGTRAANVDMLLVGPGGVFVIDVKNWRSAPEAVHGRLTAGGRSCDGEVRKLLAVTHVAEGAVAALGLSPVAVQPLMVFAGHSLAESVGRVRLLGDQEVAPALMAWRVRLTPSQVKALANHLEEVFPAYESSSVVRSGTPLQPQAPGTEALFDVTGLCDAAMEAARNGPIEGWMTFLAADQVPLVRRNWSGPARISGPAGTGKTVVALHRAAHLAQRSTGRILYVTFANNLPRVQSTFLGTMAPAVAERVEFRSLHSWARGFLEERGTAHRLNGERAETAFSHAWMRRGRPSVLAGIDRSPGYWREEIDYVIKGRGITRFEDYATLRRIRRRTNLRRAHREAVWELYEEYERIRTERGVHDFNDILSLALAECLENPGCSPYAAVIADEVQDLTLVGVRLLHALVGDTPNGLLLVGDGQQSVYPGGFRLSDAGIDVRGDRGQVLRTNYRNAKEILDAALAVVAEDAFDDIDGTRTAGHRDVDLTYHDGKVTRAVFRTAAAQDEALLEALRALGPSGWPDSAILCRSHRETSHYRDLLNRSGIPLCPLDRYDGHPVAAVKLGTYRRAKGLEFKHVHLPDHDIRTDGSADSNAPDADVMRERQELWRTQLFVAMTRARDTLWLGSVAADGRR